MDEENPEDLGPELPVSPAAWASWLNVLLGVWEAASPWVLGYGQVSALAADNAVVIGLLVVIAGLYGALTWYVWPMWVNVLAGAWLALAPSILDYSGVSVLVRANEVVIGILVIVFALVSGLSKPQMLLPE
jgi:hypothetical protein